ncbi:hypothetical protein M9H77_21123 [Catharanthus roseus]|uniref:Uncharacterized protein n=1 Tax=Catharanthus roseus TaxID=4058 RepID=A0ACC0AN55_CATRO|nr:hypothetical protein M9H77_21123 [Catharanthus roseus]
MKLANLSCTYRMYPYNLFSLSMQDSWAAAEDTNITNDDQNHRHSPCCCHRQLRTSTVRQLAWVSWSQYVGVPHSPLAHDIWPIRKRLMSYC